MWLKFHLHSTVFAGLLKAGFSNFENFNCQLGFWGKGSLGDAHNCCRSPTSWRLAALQSLLLAGSRGQNWALLRSRWRLFLVSPRLSFTISSLLTALPLAEPKLTSPAAAQRHTHSQTHMAHTTPHSHNHQPLSLLLMCILLHRQMHSQAALHLHTPSYPRVATNTHMRRYTYA